MMAQRPGSNSPGEIAVVLILSVVAMILFALFVGEPDEFDPARQTGGMESQSGYVSRKERDRAAWEASR